MKTTFTVFPVDKSPGFIINRLARELNVCLSRAFSKNGFDITAPQWAVLNRLWEKEGLHQSELAEKTTKDRHNIARMLPVLEKQGLVTRHPDRKDKRMQRVFLTTRGRNLKDRLIPIAQETLDRVFEGLTERDVAGLIRISEGMTANLAKIVND